MKKMIRRLAVVAMCYGIITQSAVAADNAASAGLALTAGALSFYVIKETGKVASTVVGFGAGVAATAVAHQVMVEGHLAKALSPEAVVVSLGVGTLSGYIVKQAVEASANIVGALGGATIAVVAYSKLSR